MPSLGLLHISAVRPEFEMITTQFGSVGLRPHDGSVVMCHVAFPACLLGDGKYVEGYIDRKPTLMYSLCGNSWVLALLKLKTKHASNVHVWNRTAPH